MYKVISKQRSARRGFCILHGFCEAKWAPPPLLYPEISVDVSYGHGFYESKERLPLAGLEKLTLFLHHGLPLHQGMYLYRKYIHM